MPEQPNKGHISVREFVNSWEKEVYELTHMDYFIYLLINELSGKLEKDFYPDFNINEPFRLSLDELANLAFNIGDGLQAFLDKNCFNGCSLGCPNKLHKPFAANEDEIRAHFVTREFDGFMASCDNREDCLYHDIKIYVVADVLLDFYNYEMGIILHEKDRKLNNLLEFIMKQIMQFTRLNGPILLATPNEIASELFQKHLSSDENIWEEVVPDASESDEDEPEAWKMDSDSVDSVFNDFEEEYANLLIKTFSQKVFYNFKKFIDEYLEISQISDLEFEYIDEFFSILILQDYLIDDDLDFEELVTFFTELFGYIDQQAGTDLNGPFKDYAAEELNEIKRTFFITRQFQQENSYMDYLLKIESNKENLLEGYYEITKLDVTGLLMMDVDVKTVHDNIDLGNFANTNLKVGDVLHLQLDTSASVWKLAYVELVYPAVSKYFLY